MMTVRRYFLIKPITRVRLQIANQNAIRTRHLELCSTIVQTIAPITYVTSMNTPLSDLPFGIGLALVMAES